MTEVKFMVGVRNPKGPVAVKVVGLLFKPSRVIGESKAIRKLC